MSSLVWVALVAALVLAAALTGAKPSNTRSIARTRLMGVGRVVLLALAVVVAAAWIAGGLG